MYCKNCGKEVKDGSKFCIHCGNELNNGNMETFKEEKKQKKMWKIVLIVIAVIFVLTRLRSFLNAQTEVAPEDWKVAEVYIAPELYVNVGNSDITYGSLYADFLNNWAKVAQENGNVNLQYTLYDIDKDNYLDLIMETPGGYYCFATTDGINSIDSGFMFSASKIGTVSFYEYPEKNGVIMENKADNGYYEIDRLEIVDSINFMGDDVKQIFCSTLSSIDTEPLTMYSLSYLLQ